MSEHLKVADLSKRYPGIDGKPLLALDRLSLSVNRGEFVSVIGSSGCGKTTLLRLIAGLDRQYQGTIFIGGEPVSGPDISRGIVFQEPRLFPWFTVEQNIALGLAADKRASGDDIVNRHIKLVGLDEFARAYPSQLSGGMAQRAALARALVNEPQILLLDEPFGALDAITRMRLQGELLGIWQRLKITTLLITHDIDEAVFLSDRIFVITCRPGRVKSVIDVNLPWPRNRNKVDYLRIRQGVLTALEKARRPRASGNP